MPQGFAHPAQWDHQLPRMHDLLAPLPPPTRAGTATALLPPPTKDPRGPQYFGSQSLAQYRSPWASERPSPGHRHEALPTRSPVAHPLSRHANDRDHGSHSRGPDHRISYPIPSADHVLGQRPATGPPPSPYPAVGAVAPYVLNGDSGLRPTRPTHDRPMADGAPARPPADHPGRPPPAPDAAAVDSPWGLTKAGKARKRLEQACVSCRKKKTKCEPLSSSAKCAPCEKNGSECFFDSAPRTRRYAPPTYASSPISPAPAAPILESPEAAAFSRRDHHPSAATSVSNSSSRSSMDIGHLLSPPSPSDSAVGHGGLERSPPHKRSRNGMALPSLLPREAANVSQLEEPGSRSEPVSPPSPPVDALNWDLDPFDATPGVTEHYLHHYFANINTTSYCIFPRDAFLAWVRADRKKTQAEKMLLYAMLAHGTVFSPKPAKVRLADRKFFESIARGALGKSVGRFSLPMVQTRLILSLLHYALGNGFRAWDYCGMAIRGACALKLNVERGVRALADGERADFGLDADTLIECRRRTFWSAYIMDRYSGFCSGHLGLLQTDSCLLRLPCDEAAYARGDIPATPFFHTREVDPHLARAADRSGLGMMAYLVEVSTVWGDVLAYGYRSEYFPPAQHREPAEAFFHAQMTTLATWRAGLPAHLHPSPANIDRAFQGGYIGVFVSLWLLYHCAAMKLCRHGRVRHMAPEHVARNLADARHHAHAVLDMMRSLAKANRETRMPESTFVVATPFAGYGILSAVDVLTSAGSLGELPALLELLSSGSEVMEELAQYWSSAQRQWKMVGERFQNLLSTVHAGGAATGKTAFYARTPMEVIFGLEHDLLYDVALDQRMRAIGMEHVSEHGDELMEIRMQKPGAIDDSHWHSALDVEPTAFSLDEAGPCTVYASEMDCRGC